MTAKIDLQTHRFRINGNSRYWCPNNLEWYL